jgi:hypothetical protein
MPGYGKDGGRCCRIAPMLAFISCSVTFSDFSVTYMTPVLVAIGMVSASPRVRVCMVTRS